MRYLSVIFIFILSCASSKDVLLIQDSNELSNYSFEYDVIKIKPDDILRIQISSQSLELSNLFNFGDSSSSNTLESFQINGYLVDAGGYIKLPLIEPLFVKDLTLNEASGLIKKYLRDQNLLLNSSVDVKIVNSYFTVIGEVNKPGRYNFIENNMNILKALGIAGDLTINGKRDDIKVLRKTENTMKVNKVDITSAKLLSSEYFQIFPDDIIIVNPNNARVKNAGIIGNSGNLLSVLSFILSTLILVTSSN